MTLIKLDLLQQGDFDRIIQVEICEDAEEHVRNWNHPAEDATDPGVSGSKVAGSLKR